MAKLAKLNGSGISMRKLDGRKVPAAEHRAAYHEAGHAVARQRLSRGGPGRSIWIDGVGARGGSNHRPGCSAPPLVLPLPDALDRIQVSLAGAIAERCATGRVDRSAEAVDRARALEIALRVSFEPETDALLRWLEIRTERLVEFYWADVQSVARALVKRRSLTPREIGAVIQGAQRAPEKTRRASRARKRAARRPRGSDASRVASGGVGPARG